VVSTLDRPPVLENNFLLVNRTYVNQINLYNEVTDWGIFIVTISRIGILLLLFENFLYSHEGNNRIATQEMRYTNML
jgi:hypothetical protein